MSRNRKIYISEGCFERVIQCATPGLHFLKRKVASSKYFYLKHTPSGKIVCDWSRAPVKFRDADLIAKVESVLTRHGDVDWTVEEGGFAPEQYERLRSIVRELRECILEREPAP